MRRRPITAPTLRDLCVTFAVFLSAWSLAGRSSGFAAEEEKSEEPPHVVVLVGDDANNYEAHRTMPRFAESLRKRGLANCQVIVAEGDMNASHFPGLQKSLQDADLLVIFFRRRGLPASDLQAIRRWLKQGKPLVGIRTANHAFSVRGELDAQHFAWEEFVPDVLGCGNHGYGPVKPGTDVEVAADAAQHPILRGISTLKWHSEGNIYRVAPIDLRAAVLLWGTVGEERQPIAWTRQYGESRIFYTSLGHPADFKSEPFLHLLRNGIAWALE